MRIREIVANIRINSKDYFVTLRLCDATGYVKETPEVFMVVDGVTYVASELEIKKVR